MTPSPAEALWNQRLVLAKVAPRIAALSTAVGHPSDLRPYQWAQLIALSIDYRPDLILELGRGMGNSTCAFTEAAAACDARVLSVCHSSSWFAYTRSRVAQVVQPSWFDRLDAKRANILSFDYRSALRSAQRVLLFWDAHGYQIAECVLGEILPLLAGRQHMVVMHDISDARYAGTGEYLSAGIWKGNYSRQRLRLGWIDSAVEQAVSVVDFASRNEIPLDSVDHDLHTKLSEPQREELRSSLGDLYSDRGDWLYFSLGDAVRPLTFPRFQKHRDLTSLVPWQLHAFAKRLVGQR